MGPGTTSSGARKDATDKAADAAGKATDVAEQAADSKEFALAARAGYVAAGILHLLVGLIALGLANGGSGSADQTGAIGELTARPGGMVLVWFCFLGCLALALFQLSEVFFGARGSSTKDKAVLRVKCGAQAGVYAAIGVTFGQFALGGSSDSSDSTSSLSASLMSHPAGSALLLAVGVGIFAVGGYFVYSGATGRFRQQLTHLPPRPAASALVILGTVGYLAKGVALGVLGVLVFISTVLNNPEESTGLDGALKSLRDQPFGIWILGAVAVGLMAYGAFMVIRSKYQRM